MAAAALLLGALLSPTPRRAAVIMTAVACGSALEALELLYRLQAGPVPADWFEAGRKVAGPVGYANAQAAFFALGIPLALWLASQSRLIIRAFGGAVAGLLIGSMLLTQSRGALVAVGAALVVQAVILRDLRLIALDILLVGVAAALWQPLKLVDAAIVDSATPPPDDFRRYAAWTLLAALGLAVAAATPREGMVRRALIGVTLTVASCAAAFGLVQGINDGSIRSAIHRGIAETNPTVLPAGTTRFGSLSLTGRLALWRVAGKMFEGAPLAGAGSGEFARVWGERRSNKDLYVLQPHSVELEIASELGAVGVALFLAFVTLVFVGVVRSKRPPPLVAAAVATLVALLLQASVDWTLSFPALVVAGFLVAGACSGAIARRSSTAAVATVQMAGLLAALGMLAVPYFSARWLAESRSEAAAAPARAWTLAARARGLNPWQSEVVSLQGQIAERTGHFRLAGRLYGRAAQLSQQPWIDEFRRARALARGGDRTASHEACHRAQVANPLEPALRHGPCAEA